MQINQELIRQARRRDLAEYLLERGEHLKKDSNGRYKHAEHDSLVFTGNAFYWNSKGEKGNAIDFLMLFYGMDFKSALSELTNTNNLNAKKELVAAPQQKQVPVHFDFKLPELNKDMRRAFAYLIKTRSIDTSIVQNLAKEKLLMQDKLGNIIFPWKNEIKEIVGADLVGTLTEKRFKGIAKQSNHNYSFNIPIGDPKEVYVFESPIDLLSFWSLHKYLKNVLLISLSGLKIETLLAYLKRYIKLTDVFLCVDNDSAAKIFIKAVQAQIKASTMLPPVGKDWNEFLQTKKQ